MTLKTTSPEETLTSRNTTRTTNTIREPMAEDPSPMQRFLAEDGRDQPWHNLSPVITNHVTSTSSKRSSSAAAATNGSTSKDTTSKVQTEGHRHDERQERPSMVHDLKYIGHIFARSESHESTRRLLVDG
ncbi:hypothetical protein AYL99_04323 [Fonsecaea erecta]|uniref:Uncharacterized protein n=1 Tax=Fonsecaea erecta TaxID=1367422 RepID=A0A178ZQN6_9EURO|nr:hypothetical protein AYL99_04323 [Fonsecaea erecta]OAP62120.1 hypothetical protein AYL99_04323 [Fonsecaea erecta]